MLTNWTDRRKEFRYENTLFSEDGMRLKAGGIEYVERPFSDKANRRFRIFLVVVLTFIFPGIPLLASWGLNEYFIWIVPLFAIIVFWAHGRIHACAGCGGKTRSLSTPHMNSPVLYLCDRCRTFFEHGQIDGGWPWK
jgi:hypothetical protein